MSETNTKPTCVGFIMDGNRRWAREKGLKTLEGHKAGHEAFTNIVRQLRDAHIEHGIFYAFSTENWNRAEEEVAYLMRLFEEAMKRILKGINEDKVRVRIVGDRSAFSEKIQGLIEEVEKKSKVYDSTTIWIALSYGGRAEITDAVNKAIKDGSEVTEESLKKFFWSSELPDPDLIIRTGGEKRLSNFLPWQSIYSELFFLDIYWPDFSQDQFDDVLDEYSDRKRNFGK